MEKNVTVIVWNQIPGSHSTMSVYMFNLYRISCIFQDLLSVAITGVDGTPYSDALFLFDVQLPEKYPSIPPLVHFLTFGAGEINPNLHKTGKVCLSLLNTWPTSDPSEKWGSHSNVLQVVLSIQGKIQLCYDYEPHSLTSIVHNEIGYPEMK